MGERFVGKVKWFNNGSGYGFITKDDDNTEYFVHFSSIKMKGYKTLVADQAVSFEIATTPKGTQAVEVTAV